MTVSNGRRQIRMRSQQSGKPGRDGPRGGDSFAGKGPESERRVKAGWPTPIDERHAIGRKGREERERRESGRSATRSPGTRAPGAFGPTLPEHENVIGDGDVT